MRRMAAIAFVPVALVAHPAIASDAARGLEVADAATAPRALDLRHVGVSLRFDWKARRAHGVAELALHALREQQELRLDAGRLRIASVRVDGRPARFQLASDDGMGNLRIPLARALAAGQDVSVSIAYATQWANDSDPQSLAGSVGKGLRFLGPSGLEPNRRRQVWVNSEPEAGRYWHPTLDAPDDMTTSELRLTVPAPLAAIGPGRLVSVDTQADGSRTFVWRDDVPHPDYRMGFAAGEYRSFEQRAGDVTLVNYAYPDELRETMDSTDRLPAMLTFFADYLGAAFPHAQYRQVFVQELAWGLPFSGLGVQTENMVDDFGTHADFRYLWNGLQAESLAGQWFGGLVAPRQWRDAWLQRGMSMFMDGLFNEHDNGEEEFRLWHLQGALATYLADWNAGNRAPVGGTDGMDAYDFVQGNHPYQKAGLVLYQLRYEIGEDAFRSGIRAFVRAHANGLAGTGDFQAAMESASGRDLDWFFEQWIRRMGHPVFRVAHGYDAASGEAVVTARQVQLVQAKDAALQARWFRGSVDIAIDGVVHRVQLQARHENTFRFPARDAPRLVRFDHGAHWIMEVEEDKPRDEWLWQLRHDDDVRGRQQAADALVALAGDTATPAAERAALRDALLEAAAGDGYWRLRWNILRALRPALLAIDKDRLAFDPDATRRLHALARDDMSWIRASAIAMLAERRSSEDVDLYLAALADRSDRVVNAAAIALGKSGDARAFPALAALIERPSWKNQSLISALYGMTELRDQRALPIALRALTDARSKHWTLLTPVWDHRLAAADTLVALGAGHRGYLRISPLLATALRERNTHDIFTLAQFLATLGDPGGLRDLQAIRARYRDDANAVRALDALEAQLRRKAG